MASFITDPSEAAFVGAVLLFTSFPALGEQSVVFALRLKNFDGSHPSFTELKGIHARIRLPFWEGDGDGDEVRGVIKGALSDIPCCSIVETKDGKELLRSSSTGSLQLSHRRCCRCVGDVGRVLDVTTVLTAVPAGPSSFNDIVRFRTSMRCTPGLPSAACLSN